MINSKKVESHKNVVQSILRNYIRAKDDNKPHLMKRVFTNSATLEMKVKTNNISFPTDTVGLEAITKVLVRNFSQTYENVYTFCFSDSFSYSMDSQENKNSNEVSCTWLVCMTERDGGNVRVGSGGYDWRFDDNSNTSTKNLAINLTNNLIITIEHMEIFEANHSKQLYEWIDNLPYPFCDSKSLIKFMPSLESLKFMRKDLISDREK